VLIQQLKELEGGGGGGGGGGGRKRNPGIHDRNPDTGTGYSQLGITNQKRMRHN
jgi:hypothetical protein